MSDQLQRKLKSSNHAMTEMTYLFERTIHEYIRYDRGCKENHLFFEGWKLQSMFLMEYKHFLILLLLLLTIYKFAGTFIPL